MRNYDDRAESILSRVHENFSPGLTLPSDVRSVTPVDVGQQSPCLGVVTCYGFLKADPGRRKVMEKEFFFL
jgi:hypothetical protein